jgi:tetratricopeptide (TPR) repeat protein
MVRAPFHVKGKREPVLAMSLGSPMESRQAGAHDETPMIGRERELQILLDALRSAVAGSGRVVELVGPPGIGKSRLLNELRSRAAGEVLWAEGDVYTGARPYAPFERLLRLRWGALDETPPEVLAARLRATTEQRAPHLVPWLPLIAIAAGIELPSTPEVDATDAGVRKQRLEELASEWLGAILGEITVLIFNDVHLMDDASADLIGRLARDAATRPWLVVLSRRPERDSPLGDHAFERIELGPLSDSDSEQLLARATDDAPLPPHTLARLTDRAGGNPMFLRELAAQLHEGGDPGALPDSVEDAIAARIDRLAPADRRLLRSAAVLGVVVDVSLLSEVLRDDASAGPGTMTSRFEALSEFMQPLDPERRQFSHQLVREVAYEGLPYRRRTDLHARTAAAIERMAAGDLSQQAELLSLHCLHGAQFEAAWRYSRIAAEHAVERYASAEAADSYRRALAAANELQGLDQLEVAAVEESLGDVCFQLGEFRGAEVALRAALRRSAGRPTAKATIELKLSRIREWSGHRGAALRWLTRAERSLAGVSTREGRQILARITFRRSRIRYLQGRQAEALTLADKAIALAREASDRRTLADALELADLASVAMGATQEPVRAEQALAIYAELADLAGEARLLNALGMLAYHRGRWPEALARYRAAETAYSRSGNRFGASISAANVAEILGDQGCVTEARATMEQAMRVWRAAGATAEIAFGEAQLGQLAARLGDTEEALRRLAVARAFYDEAGEASEVLLVDAMTADAHTHAGRHAEALAIADRTLRRARDVPGVTVATPAAHRVRGIALAALGRHDEAGLALRAALAAARSREALHEIAFALRELIANGLADSPGERSAWVSEHESLCKELGLQMAAPT